MAPSGSGKRTVIEGLGDLQDELYFAKTYTSRPRRDGAEENPKYEFVSREEFERMIEAGEFIEWATFSGNYYGTPKSEVIEPMQAGRIVFKEMELQGVEQIRELVPKEKLTVIYIDAGDWEELRARILARSAMAEDELQGRYERFVVEVQAKDEADIIVSNRTGEITAAQQHFRDVVRDKIQNVTQ